MVYVTLKGYLNRLEEGELMKSPSRRREIPNLLKISKGTGIAYSTINKMANNNIGGVRFRVLDQVMKYLGDQGFDIQIVDLIKFHDERQSA